MAKSYSEPAGRDGRSAEPWRVLAVLLLTARSSVDWQRGNSVCVLPVTRHDRPGLSTSLAQLQSASASLSSIPQKIDMIRKSRCIDILRPAAFIAPVLLLNLHYTLLGWNWKRALITSRPILTLLNTIVGFFVGNAMINQGVPKADRTETYCFEGLRGRLDVYEPMEESVAQPDEPRPVVLYFHGGAWMFGHRSFGSGVCAWLASHGAVCLSVSYRLTNSGAGIAGCIEDAWAAMRWTRANAARLNIDPSRITVAGDSAGGFLATALGTGIDPKSEDPVELSELPAAVVAIWPITTVETRTWAPQRGTDGTWEPTPAGKYFSVPSIFVPEKFGHDAQATQSRLADIFAGTLLGFGRRFFGLLPPRSYQHDQAALLSPTRLASHRGLPPVILLSGGADTVAPCEQASYFADIARVSGNNVAHLVFEGADHGRGCFNCATGRAAILSFLRYHKLLQGPKRRDDDPHDAMGGAMRAFRFQTMEYERLIFRPARDGRKTIYIKQRC